MKKYDSYSLEESTTQRIDLHKNFRSREEVLTCTNDIFYKIMVRSLGNVEFDAEAALYPGASYPVAQTSPRRSCSQTAMTNYWRTPNFPIRRH